MTRHTAVFMFSGATLFLQCGLAVLYFSGSPFAGGPLVSSLILLAIVIALYGVFAWLMPIRHRTSPTSDSGRKLVLFAQLAIMVVALVATLIYIPTTAPLELIKRLTIANYTPQYDPLEIRLSGAYMPVWCQALLEFARRISAPYCMIELTFGGMRKTVHPLVSVVVWLLVTIFALATLERAVGVLYFSAAILALLFSSGIKRALTNKYTYISLVGVVFVIVAFKQLQYGDFAPVSLTKNSEIVKELSAGISEPAKQDVEIEGSHPTLRYANYFLQSVTERIFLSSVAMIVYSSQTYNETNFQHWSKTRVFSFLGYGTYVNSLDTVSGGHNEAFPVTYIGDLWRNGGPLYFPFYAILISIVLYCLDRQIFAEREFIALKVCASFGILFLFYGNAFNATSCISIAVALVLAFALRYMPDRRRKTAR